MRALRVLFVVVAVLCAFTAVWHALRALSPATEDTSSPARHAVFVLVNVACAVCFVVRPRFFAFVFPLLALQQIVSHGGDALHSIALDAAPAPVDVVVALAMPALAVLLLVERAHRSKALRNTTRA